MNVKNNIGEIIPVDAFSKLVDIISDNFYEPKFRTDIVVASRDLVKELDGIENLFTGRDLVGGKFELRARYLLDSDTVKDFYSQSTNVLENSVGPVVSAMDSFEVGAHRNIESEMAAERLREYFLFERTHVILSYKNKQMSTFEIEDINLSMNPQVCITPSKIIVEALPYTPIDQNLISLFENIKRDYSLDLTINNNSRKESDL